MWDNNNEEGRFRALADIESDISVIRSRRSLFAAVTALRDRLDVQHAVYVWINRSAGPVMIGTYPETWVARYKDRGYRHYDPIVIDTHKSGVVTSWSDLDWSHDHLRAFLDDAVSHGVGPFGLSVPAFGPAGQFALLSLSHHGPEDVFKDIVSGMSATFLRIASLINEQVIRINRDRLVRGEVKLSRREREVATMTAMGYTRLKIARTLDISEHTVREHADSFREKMASNNITQAVARASCAGLIVV